MIGEWLGGGEGETRLELDPAVMRALDLDSEQLDQRVLGQDGEQRQSVL